MENRILQRSGGMGRRGQTRQTMRKYGVHGADAPHPDARFMCPEQTFFLLM